MLKEAAAQLLPSSTHTTDKYRKLEPPALTFDILRVAILWHVNKSVTDTLGIKTGWKYVCTSSIVKDAKDLMTCSNM